MISKTRMVVPQQTCEVEFNFEEFLMERTEMEKKELTMCVLEELSNPEDIIYEFFDEHDYCLDDYVNALPKKDLQDMVVKLSKRMEDLA